jgi:acetyl-CoA synthetase
MSVELFPVPEGAATTAFVDKATYKAMYERSVTDPEGFWGEMGQRLDWIKPYSKVKDTRYAPDVSIKWFEDGVLNVSANCVDRHLATRGDQTAIIFEGDDPNDSRHITYRELHREVSRFANVLKAHGVKKGDRVTIYLPMIPASARSTPSCSPGSRRTASPAASRTAIPRSCSPPTKACAAAARFRSRPTSTRRWPSARATRRSSSSSGPAARWR